MKIREKVLTILGVLGMLALIGVPAYLAHGTATTTDIQTMSRSGLVNSYLMGASTTIPAGVLVCVDSAGAAENCSNTSSYKVVGVSIENKTSTTTLVTPIRVAAGQVYKFAQSGLAQTDVGAIAYDSDNKTVTATSGNNVVVGIVSSYVSASTVWVYIPLTNAAITPSSYYAVSSVTSMLDSSTNVTNIGLTGDTVRLITIPEKTATILGAYGYCRVAGTATAATQLEFDVLYGGTTIWTTKPKITKAATCPCNTYSAGTGVTAGVLSANIVVPAGTALTVNYDITDGSTVTTRFKRCAVTVWFKTSVQ